MLSKFYGDTDKNIRTLFEEARLKSPSIILFDEIDGLCPVRNHKQEQVHNSVVTSLLAEIDGLDDRANSKIVIIATTNRPGKMPKLCSCQEKSPSTLKLLIIPKEIVFFFQAKKSLKT